MATHGACRHRDAQLVQAAEIGQVLRRSLQLRIRSQRQAEERLDGFQRAALLLQLVEKLLQAMQSQQRLVGRDTGDGRAIIVVAVPKVNRCDNEGLGLRVQHALEEDAVVTRKERADLAGAVTQGVAVAAEGGDCSQGSPVQGHPHQLQRVVPEERRAIPGQWEARI